MRFWHGKEYYCTNHKKLIQKDGGCEKWQAQKTEYDLSVERVDSVIDDIKVLLGYLE